MFTFITFDIDRNNARNTIAVLEGKRQELVPSKPILYFFFLEEYNSLYRSDEQFGKLFMILASIAIIISCLGLFGFAAFSMSTRTKEMGIRKVLRSSIPQVVFELNRDFLLIIFFAYLLSLPVSWYIIDQWLSRFAYNDGISWLSFVIGGLSARMIAVLTVSYHTLRFARVNPIECLRSE